MFFTIDDIISGKKYNVNIMWITSLKNGDDSKSAPNFELLLYQGDGGRPLVESFATAEERKERRETILDAGSFFHLDDIHYNIVWVQSIAKVNAGDPLYDGNLSQRPGVSVTFANGRTIYGIFDTEDERDEFYNLLLEALISGGLVQKPTYGDFPKNGNPNCIYLAKDTGITYYWDKFLKTYVTTGSGGRKGVYQYSGKLSATMGAKETLDKSDLREIVKATVDFMETSDVLDDEGVHAIIIENNDTTVEVVTIADQTIDSFRQVATLADLPATGKTNILFYVDDIDEFRTWDESVNSWIEPFHPIVFGDIAVADARTNTLYVDNTIAKYTTDNLSWVYLSSVLFADPDIADAIINTLYINGTVAKYTVDNSEWIYLSSVFFEDPDVADAITEALYINGNTAKYTLDNVEWTFITPDAVLYKRDEEYHEGMFVYLNNVLTKTLKKFTSNNTEADEFASFNKDILDGNLEVIVDAYTRTNVQYDLTYQVDGISQEFNIPTAITSDRSLLVFYAGQLLTEGINYTIDFTNSKLKLSLEQPPEVSEDKHLVLIAGNIESTPPMVRTVTGIDTGMVDNTDPLNPVVLHDDSKIDKDVATDSDRFIEGKTEASKDAKTVVIEKTSLNVDDNSSAKKRYIIKSSDESIVFDLVEVDSETTEVDLIVDNANSTNVAYDLTNQLDGVKQTFDIEPIINDKKSLILFYAGQHLVRGVNYSVDFTNHILTTYLDEAPDADEDKHLVLIVGNTTVTDVVQSVAGDVVDNTDPMNPIILHDDSKIDKDVVSSVVTDIDVEEVDDSAEIIITSTDTDDGSTSNEKIILKSGDDNVKISVHTLNPQIKEIKITAQGNTVITENAIIFDGVRDEFTLPNHIDVSKPIMVAVNGVVLTSGSDADYEIIGNNIKFAYVFDIDSSVIIINFK